MLVSSWLTELINSLLFYILPTIINVRFTKIVIFYKLIGFKAVNNAFSQFEGAFAGYGQEGCRSQNGSGRYLCAY